MFPLIELLAWLRDVTPHPIKLCFWQALDLYGQPWFYVSIAVILVLERVRPAIPQQRVFSRGLAQDFLWFNLDFVFKVTALTGFIGLLELAFSRVAGGFSLAAFDSLPVGGKVLVSFVLADFLQWFHHRVRHRITVFWRFHEVHHAQRELNLFTDLRVHAVEYLVAQLLIFVPMLMLKLTPYALGVGTLMAWYTKFIHANVRTNLGPLKHVLVSPQFHRIHHSIEPRHRDKNFGVVLTVWDRAFGTLHPHYDEYPQAGLEDVWFEPPRGVSPVAWFGGLVAEVLYPFSQLLPSRSRP